MCGVYMCACVYVERRRDFYLGKDAVAAIEEALTSLLYVPTSIISSIVGTCRFAKDLAIDFNLFPTFP